MLDTTDLDARDVDAMFDRIDELFADPQPSSADGADRPPSEFKDDPSSDRLAGILTGARVPFRVEQRIAPLVDDRLPGPSEFSPVVCHDLSTSGVAFLLPNRPDFTSIVFAMGDSSAVKYIKARVVHCTDVLVDASGLVKRADGEDIADSSSDGTTQPMVLVGCQFLHDLPADQIADEPRDSLAP